MITDTELERLVLELVRKQSVPFIAKVYRDGRVKMWEDAQTLLDELE